MKYTVFVVYGQCVCCVVVSLEAAHSTDANEEDYEIDEEALYVMAVTGDNQLEEVCMCSV